MSQISQKTGPTVPDQKAVERGLSRGRQLRAQAFTGALSALFSRRTDREIDRSSSKLSDCAAPA